MSAAAPATASTPTPPADGSRRGPRSWTRTGALATAPLLLAVLALVHPGQAVSQLDLHDGGVWLTNSAELKLGRYSSTVDELNGGLVATAADLDVLQDGADVVLVEPGSIAVVDPASVTPRAEAAVPAAAEVTMAAGTVAVLDPADGSLWAATTDSLRDLRTDAGTADLDLGDGGRAVVTTSGTVLAAAADGALSTLAVDGAGTTVAAGDRLAGDPVAGWDAVTAVGDEAVALAGASLRTGSAAVDLSRYGSPLALQQPGPASGSVLVASPIALLEVPLDGGTVREHRSGGTGAPAAPVRVGTCSHGAWAAATGSYLVACDGEDEHRLDLAGMSAQDALVFRVNRGVVVLNDTGRGRVWVPTRDPELREPNWQDVEPERREQDSDDDSDARQSTQDLLTECTPQSAPPTAADDEFGLRPGRTTVLPVVDNDASSDCGVLVVSEFDPLPAAFGTLVPVHGGRALQVDLADGASGSASFTYTVTDGRGSSAPSTATVRLGIRADGTNGAPVQVRVPSLVVEQDARASLEVLPGFLDPDGDDLVLVGATAGAATVRARPDGQVTVTADGGALGRVDVRLLVSDGTDTVEGLLTLDVRPAGSAAPQVDPVHAVTEVDVPVTVRALDAVRGGSREPARLAAVDPLTGVTVEPDLDAGTFRFVAPRAGTYYVTFAVAAGPQQTAGVARVDVRDRPAQPGGPLAVGDRALLPAGGEVTVDPLANDVDPAGGVLVLRSVDVPPESGLRVAAVGHELLTITAVRALQGPATFDYVVSNGVAEARGQVVVRPVPAGATQQPPVVEDVTAAVRTGGVVTVPVLEHAVDPDGDPLTLVPELAEPLPAGQGLLFVSGDVLRYRAPAGPTTAVAAFDVRDRAGNVTTARLTVTVHASDAATKAPPRPRPVTARVFAGETTRIAVPLVGIDADGDGVTLLGQDRAPDKGRVVGMGADWLEYEAYADQSGTDEFTYAVEDWVGQRAVATVRVGIAERPADADPVVARDDQVSVRPGQLVEVRVLDNDVDPGGDELRLEPGLELQPGVDARVTGRRIVVRAPHRTGVLQVAYTASNARGGRDRAVLTVDVSADAAVLPPVARDVVVPATQTIGRTQVEVDVLALATNPSGPIGDLAVSVDPSAAAVATATPAGSVVVTLVAEAQTVPYVLTNTADAGGARSTAFITVPALGDFPPVPRPRAPALQVLAGAELTVRLAEQVQVAPGRTARITDPARVQATRADGSPLVRGDDRTTVVFRAPRSYAGPASVSVEVTDATGPGDPGARVRTLTLPITVLAAEDHPPTFAPAVVDVAPGEAPVAVDLTAFTSDPVGAGDDAAYRYTVTSAVPEGFTATLDRTVLRVAASADAARGTSGSLGLSIGYGAAEVGARVELRVVASTRPLARVVDATVPDGVEGRATTVDVLAGAFNPFPGSAQVSGSQVSVRPAEGFIGTMVTRFSVRDATGDPARQVDGRVSVVVRGRPGAPTPPRVVEVRDRAVVLAWDAPAINGEPISAYRVTAQPGDLAQECAGTTCTVEGLANDTTYTFTVAARNAVDWSPESGASAPARPDRRPETPAAPTVVAGDASLTATWAAAATTGSPVSRYTVEVSPAPAGGATLTTAGTSVTVGGLTNGVAYTVRVRAHNAATEPSDWSAPSAGQVPAGPPASPSPTATRQGSGWFDGAGRVDLAWTTPAGNGDPVSAYEVAVDGGTVQTLPGSATTWAFTAAERGVTYTFGVRARNRSGWSAWGTVTGGTWSAPSAPRGASAQAGPADAAYGQGSVTYSWEPPADAGGAGLTITGYQLEGVAALVGGTSYTATGLTGGPTPPTRVRAVSSAGEVSEWAPVASTTVVTVPQAPTATVRADVDGRLVIEWQSRDPGGAPVEAARYRVVDHGDWVTVGDGRDHGAVTADHRPGPGEPVRVLVQVRSLGGWSEAVEVTGVPVPDQEEQP
ncbi:Ig-like domain-containing protein [Cellulomonas aerilata]|uniref:Ig-like domain-containing protein n=1 Tax=Cellulomonas aerilata TaxID=515326 RepID=UPI0011BFCBDA|nr:Ig-like domain-containing protein [Cellulomonas aerilata]